MPGFDGTGPMGRGPTGWGFGPCGRGIRRGYGRGFGWRYPGWGYAEPITFSKIEQKKILEAELKEIETERQEIAKRLKELEK